MKNLYKKMTYEDKFARKYYCNPERFMPKVKRINHKVFRKKIKNETQQMISDFFFEGEICIK